MKPWREIAVPHRDVLEGTFHKSCSLGWVSWCLDLGQFDDSLYDSHIINVRTIRWLLPDLWTVITNQLSTHGCGSLLDEDQES